MNKNEVKDKISIFVKKASLECDKVAYPLLVYYKLTMVQYKILKYLYINPPATVCQRDIEKFFSMTNPTVTGVLKNLERDGWVERLSNPHDARSKLLQLTDKSLRVKQELFCIGNEIENTFTAELTAEEREQLLQLLKKLVQSFSQSSAF
ncbi:MarR family winged helix-turn-helix transcriptional regulator [Selenomonas ruminantium]|uniref:MarR family winged helix-turn-helix transcriptional regulator n=1 Tax=Selenomonas ruminantium TaxID=971 RepID=UPI001567FF94|nr:MarR family transcriptional regulator [Selenomonas ruminantium]